MSFYIKALRTDHFDVLFFFDNFVKLFSFRLQINQIHVYKTKFVTPEQNQIIQIDYFNEVLFFVLQAIS